MKTGIEILDKYTTYYLDQVHKRGFEEVSYGEILSELGEAYANAVKNYDESKGAVFNTYCITCFKNAITHFLARIRAEKYGLEYVNFADVESMADNNQPSVEDLMHTQETKVGIMQKLKGRELLIFNELVDTSEKVNAVLAQIDAKYDDQQKDVIKFKAGGRMRHALSLVYGFSPRNVRHHIEKIRIVAKKELDLLAIA